MRNSILSNLYNDKDVNDTINKMQPDYLREDLKQELFVVLCEQPEERLKEMIEKKYLKYYCARVIINMIQSNTSKFYKMFRRTNVELTFDIKEEETLDIPCPNELIKDLYWYEKELLKLYAEKGSIRSVAKLTGIPATSIHYSIKKARQCIKF